MTIARNGVDNGIPTPSVIKCKHIKVQGSLYLMSTDQQAGLMHTLNWTCFIVFVPQVVYDNAPGGDVANYVQIYQYWNAIVQDHPEWIMGRKLVSPKWQGGVPGEKALTNFSFTSGKLSRNLRSGDRILLVFLGSFLGQEPPTNPPTQKVLLQGEIATCTN